jgi:LuxR family maltose regulon positive regulatory protein
VARLALARGRPLDNEDGFDVDGRWTTAQAVEAELLRHRTLPGVRVHLRRAVELGAGRGFVWTFVREGPAVVEGLRRLMAQDADARNTPLAAALREPSTPRRDGPPRLVEPLSAKELDVLAYLPSHLSTHEMARQLFVSVNTVRTHVKAIYRKLDVSSRSAAVQRAAALGLLDPT